jgi:DNA-binding CsgD family transcriptional regulator
MGLKGAEIDLARAFELIEGSPDLGQAVTSVRDLLRVDHLVYHSSKLGVSPSVDPYIRLTYPSEWVKRYLERGYVDVDPVLREGFQRSLPFDWGELRITTAVEAAFMQDALAHGVGPHGMSIPVRTKAGHRGLVSLSASGAAEEWCEFRLANVAKLVSIANRIHRRAASEIFGASPIHLTARELECLRWISLGKNAREVAAILNISHYTARDYLKSARFKLDCVTLPQAVIKAVKLGLLKL